jgi:hypothetical protein
MYLGLVSFERKKNLVRNSLCVVSSYLAGWYLISMKSPIAVETAQGITASVLTETQFTHPDFEVVNMPITEQRELAEMGAYIERTLLPDTPGRKTMEVRDLIERTRAVDAARTIMSTELGQMNNLNPRRRLSNVHPDSTGQRGSAGGREGDDM